MSQQTSSGNPRHLIQQALWLEYVTIGWNVIEAAVALIAGYLAGSIALVGFGLDSVIEVTAASAVLWRLRCELGCSHSKHTDQERRALRVIGVTFLLLAGYIGYEAGTMLWHREAPQVSHVGMVLAVLSALIMPYLVLRKLRVAQRIKSRALAADAMETLICGYLSVALLVGLVLNAWLGWWWADPVAALAMLPIILRESHRAFSEA